MSVIRQIQKEQREWSADNFPGRGENLKLGSSWMPLLGIIEEVGELAHSHLKHEQGIRGSDEKHTNAAKDAVGDIVVFLLDYCSSRGWDFEDTVATVWAEVKERNWKKDPKNS